MKLIKYSIFKIIVVLYFPVLSFSQNLFTGQIHKYYQLVEESKVQDSLVISYQNSFKGSLKFLLNDSLIYEASLTPEVKADILGNIVLKRTINATCPQVLTIILNNEFYTNVVLEFIHPYMRVGYFPQKRTLLISYASFRAFNE